MGRRWLALPASYAFSDPLFSTGIAWSLLGVERAADLLLGARGGLPEEAALERYGALLAREAEHVERLVAAAYRVMGDFPRLVPLTWLYFAAASWSESRQRLAPGGRADAWEGFLGARDPHLGPAFLEVAERLDAPPAELERWAFHAIGPRNVAGLGASDRQNLYPTDLDLLVDGADKLGLARQEVREALPRLARGELVTA